MAIPVPDLNPIENEWAELQHGSGNLKDLFGGMVSDLLSVALQTHLAL